MAVRSPFNPLDKYQSYSVHYLMMVCRSTEAAKPFITNDDTLQDLAGQAKSLEAINRVKQLGDPIQIDELKDTAYLILDTRRFSQFSVQDLKYEIWVNGLSRGNSPANLATDLSMTILDSVGVSFVNFMQELMDVKLNTNFDGLVFLLRLIFVGHEENGSTTTVQSETIPMHLNKMEINLDHSKGIYNLEFLPNLNFDPVRHARFLTIGTSTTYTTGAGNTLGGLIDSFEKSLNDKSKSYFDDVQRIAPVGRRVDYRITIPDAWRPFEVNGPSVGAALDRKFKADQEDEQRRIQAAKDAGKIIDSYVAAPRGYTIPDVLDLMFKAIPKVIEAGLFSTTSGPRQVRFHKYITGFTSDDERLTIHVDVVEFIIPDLFAKETSTPKQAEALDDQFYNKPEIIDGATVRLPRNFLEWDYIFTGTNDSILNFDLKLEDVQMLRTMNSQIGGVALRDSVDKNGNLIDGKWIGANDLIYARRYDPLVVPLDTKAALDNFKRISALNKQSEEARDSVAKVERYITNLSMFYAASPIQAVMTIKGNPLILHKFNIGKLLPHGTKATQAAPQKNPNEDYRKQLENEILEKNVGAFTRGETTGTFVFNINFNTKSYATSPVFARVNVYGPDPDNDTGDSLSRFSKSVLSNNFYVIFKVTNIISGHSFTQEIELTNHTMFKQPEIDKKPEVKKQ